MRHISLRYRAGLASAAITLAMAAAPAAQAVPVTEWAVTVDAVFANVVPAGVVVSLDNKSLSWGSGTFGPSGLAISNAPSNTQVTTNGPGVANVSLTHTNNPINAGGTNHLTNVNIEWTLTLTPLAPNPGPLDMNPIFSLSFLETPNADAICADGNPSPGPGNIHANGCADIFVFGSTALNTPFSYDGEDYFLSFTEYTSGLNKLFDPACFAVTGSPASCLGFQTAENAATTIQFALMITSEPVSIPEPATLGLFGLALAGMAGVIRRRKLQA